MNLVNELQVSAENDDVLTVLRKTKRLASKLGRQDIAEWLKAEQDGYTNLAEVPDYRKINVAVAYNTNGYIPAGFHLLKNGIYDLPSFEGIPRIPLAESISSILSMIADIKSGQGIYSSVDEGTELSRSMRSIYRFDPGVARQVTFLLRFNDVQVKAIPERIKDRVLDWACALEYAGVNGEGLSFSEKEKEISHNITFNIHDSNIGQLNNQGMNKQGE